MKHYFGSSLYHRCLHMHLSNCLKGSSVHEEPKVPMSIPAFSISIIQHSQECRISTCTIFSYFIGIKFPYEQWVSSLPRFLFKILSSLVFTIASHRQLRLPPTSSTAAIPTTPPWRSSIASIMSLPPLVASNRHISWPWAPSVIITDCLLALLQLPSKVLIYRNCHHHSQWSSPLSVSLLTRG